MQSEFFIDISRLLSRTGRSRLPTGVDRVCLAYIERWGQQAQAVIQKGRWRRIVPYAHSQALFELLLHPPIDFRRRMHAQIARACVPPWPVQDAAGKPVFHLGHVGTEVSGFSQWVGDTHQKALYFVHDLIPISHAEYCRPGEQQAHARRLTVMLHSGAGLIANSQHTLDMLAQWAARQALAMPPSVIALLAPARLQTRKTGAAPLAQPYFVVLGTIEPRKNHLLLLNIWRELATRLGDACPHLVVVGQRGWECENVVDMLERCEALQPFVHEIPACADAELANYLHHAQALLFPSFTEGFGMPLLEALALGTPVIASNLAVFREIAGDVPDYLDPTDGPAWTQAISDYARLPAERRAAQLQRLAGLRMPTWEDHFAQVEHLLGQLA